MSDKAVAIIPARLAALRLPNKPLLDIAGKPMIQHVYERARKATRLAGVLVATPDEEIRAVVEGFGGRAVMTSAAHRTGTDRVAEAAESLPPDVGFIVNIQGDEPLIEPATIDQLTGALMDGEEAMASVMCPLPEGREHDPAVVKVVCDVRGVALYFSRSPLPHRRNEDAPYRPMQHIGMYAYRREFLRRFPTLEQTPLERVESLEQLRVLENGYRIRLVETDRVPESVDVPEDLERVRGLFAGGG
ncbi:MAG: 3-deoxy-manno-octulosonate cytidylyltransferase [Capsulimonadales bacterium]|nr:3-deoxy-manno-octulosonate cytidylyltransferase [Capsulimonadales bacterium]